MNQSDGAEKVRIFKEVLNCNSSISQLELAPAGELIEPEKVMGPSYTYLFNNETNNRSLEFRFRPQHNEFADSVLVYIRNLRNNKYMEIGNYLDAIGLLPNNLPFRLDTYPGSFTEQLKHFFKFMDAAFQEETLRNILIGKAEVIEFSTDWMDLK